MSTTSLTKLLRIARPRFRFAMSTLSNDVADPGSIAADVQDYYGKRLKTSADLKTNVCTVTSGGGMTANAKAAYKLLHEEVTSKYYGCGTIVPEAIEGDRFYFDE